MMRNKIALMPMGFLFPRERQTGTCLRAPSGSLWHNNLLPNNDEFTFRTCRNNWINAILKMMGALFAVPYLA